MITYVNLNMPGLLAIARATHEDSYWTQKIGYEL